MHLVIAKKALKKINIFNPRPTKNGVLVLFLVVWVIGISGVLAGRLIKLFHI